MTDSIELVLVAIACGSIGLALLVFIELDRARCRQLRLLEERVRTLELDAGLESWSRNSG